jgi:hypothetical protein
MGLTKIHSDTGYAISDKQAPARGRRGTCGVRMGNQLPILPVCGARQAGGVSPEAAGGTRGRGGDAWVSARPRRACQGDLSLWANSRETGKEPPSNGSSEAQRERMHGEGFLL